MADFEVSRSTRIDAPPERIHPLLDDFHEWRRWSPWEEVDPELRREYAGPESGVGSRYAWEGNRKAGKGTMEMVASTPERVEVRLIFEKPFKATNRVTFELARAGEQATDVTWRMDGTNKGPAALVSRVVGMDRLIGKDFDKGLDRLKRAAESG